MASITYDKLQRFRNDLIDSNRKKHPRSELPDRKLTPATVNRIMACLRHMLTCANEQWDMLLVNPFKNKPSLMLKENNLRKQFLSEDEIKRLLAVSPQHLQDLMRHADVKTTSRYAHLDDKTRQQAAARLNGLTG